MITKIRRNGSIDDQDAVGVGAAPAAWAKAGVMTHQEVPV